MAELSEAIRSTCACKAGIRWTVGGSRPGVVIARPGSPAHLGLLVLLVSILGGGSRAGAAPPTEAVFRRFADAVVQIRVTEKGSGAKAVIGSGFFADHAGRMVTNYHVVSKLVLHPDRYVAERVDHLGDAEMVHIEAVDAVHDLAVLRGASAPRTALELMDGEPAHGTRLYAMGHPHDLGLSIVEGTYNGLLEHSLYQRLHFTGSLNPGMSGGPTLTARGEVVGVNVRSAGNQVSFLVPIALARALLAGPALAGERPPPRWLDVVRDQLLAHQETYFATLLAADALPAVTLGGIVLPGKLAPFLRCWGDAARDESKPYAVITQECATDDYVFVSDQLLSGVVRYRHHVLTTEELNTFQFHALFSDYFGTHYGEFYGNEEEVTAFRCRQRLVRNRDVPMKVALCLRAYRRLPGLYDAVLRAAVLGARTRGAETSLALSGVSAATVQRVVGRYLGVIEWAK